MFRKVTTAIFALAICFINSFCSAEIIAEGSSSLYVDWKIESDGTMTISGDGDTGNYLIEEKSTDKNFVFYTAPWNDYKSHITKIIVEEGITGIGSMTFNDCINLREVVLSNSVTSIGRLAFWHCANLETISMSPNVTVATDAFKGCTKLSNMQVTVSGTNTAIAASSNLNAHEYTRWSKPVKSYLYVEDNNLVRLENIGDRIIIEKYSPEFKLIDSQRLDIDFEIWGGFYAGSDANYIITGKQNDAESDANEVIRVMKYDKDWNFISQAQLFGVNTKIPFSAASVRCAEGSGMLFIRTGHQMYKSPDGLNHQSSMSIVIKESDMKVRRVDYLVSHDSMSYVSHSFNQFVIVDDNKNLVMFDHGDAYPRAGVLARFKSNSESFELVKFTGAVGDNATGASIGGLAETANSYVTAYNYDGVGGSKDDYFNVVNRRDLYVNFTSKTNFTNTGTKTVKISLPDKNIGSGTPIIAPINQSGGYILWNETKFDGQFFMPTGKINYMRYDGNNNVSTVTSVAAQLSDCQPIIYNGQIVWYVTNNSVPTFYTLDETGLTEHKF